MDTPAPSRPRLRAEILIVLGLSLGQSAVWAVWRLVERYNRETPVGQQTATLNPSASQIQVLDAVAQVLSIGFRVVPVILAMYLLSVGGANAWHRLGLRWKGDGARSPWSDLGTGAGLAALIGLPGLGLYFVGRALGQTVNINTSGLPDAWWSITVLFMAAMAAAVLEETIAVGYLMTRLKEMAWSPIAMIAASALLRGSYHLYQGWPMALGNAVMGTVFAWYFLRRGRVGPLIAAHALLDIVSFVGPEVLPDSWLAALDLV